MIKSNWKNPQKFHRKNWILKYFFDFFANMRFTYLRLTIEIYVIEEYFFENDVQNKYIYAYLESTLINGNPIWPVQVVMTFPTGLPLAVSNEAQRSSVCVF